MLSKIMKTEISGTTVLFLVVLCRYEIWSVSRREYGVEEII